MEFKSDCVGRTKGNASGNGRGGEGQGEIKEGRRSKPPWVGLYKVQKERKRIVENCALHEAAKGISAGARGRAIRFFPR